MNPTLLKILEGIIAATPLLAIARSASRPARFDPALGARVLRHGWVVRGIGWVGLVFFLARAVGMIASGEPFGGKEAGLAVGLLAFAASMACLVIESMGVRILLTDRGIAGYSPWRFPRSIAWDEVVSVKYSLAMQWFVIEGPGGEVIRVHTAISGAGGLVAEIRSRLQPSIYRPAQTAFHLVGR